MARWGLASLYLPCGFQACHVLGVVRPVMRMILVISMISPTAFPVPSGATRAEQRVVRTGRVKAIVIIASLVLEWFNEPTEGIRVFFPFFWRLWCDLAA